MLAVPGSRGATTAPVRPTAARLVAPLVLWLAAVVVMFCIPAAAQAATGPASLSVSPGAFSPNGDKIKDTVKVRVKITASARLFVGVYDPKGRLVKTLQPWRARAAGTRAYTWNGLKSGKPVANARYTVRAKVKVGTRVRTVGRAVTLDTLAPSVTAADERLRLFAGGGLSAGVAYAASGDAVSAHLKVCLPGGGDAPGTLVAETAPVSAAASGSLAWDGTALKGDLVAEGLYAVCVVITDTAGNSASSRPAAVVVYQPTPVHGVVVDGKGAPVAGATVTVEGTSVSTTSGGDGTFSLAACPMGFRVFAAASGAQTGSVRAKVNMTTGSVRIALGTVARSSAPWAESAGGVAAVPPAATAPALARSATPRDNVTISGHLTYLNENNIAVPMSGVKVVLQDDATFFWDDLYTETSGNDGAFSFTYDPDDIWDSWGEPDVRVIAYAEDGDEDICAVCNGYWSIDPYTFVATQTWDDNTSSHTGLTCIKSGDDRVAWFILDCARTAHDHWQQLTGFDRPYVWADYPVDTGDDTGQFEISEAYTCINIKQGDSAWRPAVTYHEYGHSVLYAAYDLGRDCNAYAAYQHVGFSFYETTAGKWYTQQDPTAGYDTEGGAWGALTEGFAEFFAAVVMDWDRGGISGAGTYERNYVRTNPSTGAELDGSLVAHSVSRFLWDLHDDDATPLCCDWMWSGAPPVKVPAHSIARPVGPLGSGDDDRLSNSGSAPAGGMLAKLWTVLDNDWPADIGELRQDLRGRFTTSQLYYRGVDAALYSQGILRDEITETVPHINQALVSGTKNADGSYRGTVKVWCDVTDPDSPGGDWDLNHVKIRLEWGWVSPSGGATSWAPLGFTLTRSPTPPPGKSGDSWFVMDWDTLAETAIEIAYAASPPGFDENASRTDMVVPQRRTDVRLRVIAGDDLAFSQPVALAPNTVDNRPGLFSRYAVAPTYASGTAIRWPADTWAATQYATYELWYKPDANAWGTIAALTYADPNAPFPGNRYPVMEIGIDMSANAFFSINQPGTNGPGSGTVHVVYSTTALQPGTWYHLAAQYGAGGQKLYVNGVAEGLNQDYHGWPRPDSGSPSAPAFSLGQLGDWIANTALGCYEELKVSATERHVFNTFALPTEPYADPDSVTVILDHFDGSTNGTNNGFTFGP